MRTCGPEAAVTRVLAVTCVVYLEVVPYTNCTWAIDTVGISLPQSGHARDHFWRLCDA